MTEIVPVPGQVQGNDIENQADEFADAAERLTGLLTALAREPSPSLDVIAVFQGLSRAAGSMADVAAELRRQEWVEVGTRTGSRSGMERRPGGPEVGRGHLQVGG